MVKKHFLITRSTILLAVLALFPLVSLSAQAKYALVIGNGAYTEGAPLKNAVNDANDITAALQGLGFTVDTLLNASLDKMDDAAVRLKNRLSVSKDSYGFFFYAGHGVQADGVNYLLPVDARIPEKNFLKIRAFAMQPILDMLNDAGNALNVIVLDACRDLPMAWSRSADRGLSVVSRQPAKSIIMYATAAGKTASDGTGRNGLFTQHLLTNLKTPGLDVKEVFNRTGDAVTNASNHTQNPAIYLSFYGTAYLGSAPASAPGSTAVTTAPANTNQDAVLHYEKGEASYNRGDYDMAIAEFNQAIRINPNYADAYIYRGIAYRNKEDYDRAIGDYTEAIRLDPNYAKAYYNRGVAYRNKKDYDRAIADYTEAIRINPNYADAYYNRGVEYGNKKDYDREIADYTEAIRLDPNYAYAYNNRGVAYGNKKDYDREIGDYTEAIRINPNLAEAYNNRGWAWEQKGNKAKADADYAKARQLGYK
ncbi:hypothetical protein FACS1894137_09940 [Spirochaetia bacterium]|nr:hypothetical protein FACS1894137_09940 [Spirochaetia bacterium]